MSNYNKELQAVFVHVPKAAGTSLSVPLWNRGNGHKTVADFEAQLGPTFIKQFIWAFVRNPYDRIVSAYEDCPEIFEFAPTFESFIGQIWKRRNDLEGLRFLRETGAPRFGFPIGRLHFQPMHLLLQDKAGELRPHFIGKFENLKADFLELQGMLGQDPAPLVHRNKRAGKPKRRNSRWQSLYTGKLAAQVRDIYALDFDYFNYSTDFPT